MFHGASSGNNHSRTTLKDNKHRKTTFPASLLAGKNPDKRRPRANSQTAKQPNSQTAKQPNSQTAKQPNSQTAAVYSFARQTQPTPHLIPPQKRATN
jgi:hypothetical protein